MGSLPRIVPILGRTAQPSTSICTAKDGRRGQSMLNGYCRDNEGSKSQQERNVYLSPTCKLGEPIDHHGVGKVWKIRRMKYPGVYSQNGHSLQPKLWGKMFQRKKRVEGKGENGGGRIAGTSLSRTHRALACAYTVANKYRRVSIESCARLSLDNVLV